jgi:solute carrier family 34 (sodium-dependent phosphate cotransporter)
MFAGSHLFVGSGLPGAALSEAAAGGILLAASLILMIVCLVTMVNTLNSLLRGPMAKIVRRTINADFPGCFSFLTGYVALLIGAGVTVLVQSSSVFTSALTPLVGIGVVTVERVYPLTLGSNIGTTVTSLLAALTADPNMIKYTIQISMCHLFFNISGILIWYPIPLLRRVPISLAKKLGNTTAKYRWFAVVYLILLYLLFPLAIFGLSVASIWALVGVGIPVIIIAIFVVIVNIIQSKRPNWLPEFLRSWDFLPLPLHSLEPYDRVITVCFRSSLYRKCCKCKSCGQESDTSEVNRASYTTSDNEKPHVPSEYRVEYSDLSKDGCVNESYDNTSDFHTSRM